jgi:hypothetical protein
MSTVGSVRGSRMRWRLTVALVSLLLVAGCAADPLAGPPAAPTPAGERLDMRTAIPLGFMYEDRDGPNGGGGSVPPCLGQPVAHYGIARRIDERVDLPVINHNLYVYPSVAAATRVFAQAAADAGALLACHGWTGAQPISVSRPPYGAEAVMVTFPLPLDGAGEHAGEPAPILLFRVGASIIQLGAHPGAGPRDTERRGQAEMEKDARVMEDRMCLYDPECGPQAGLPAQLRDLRDGDKAWAAVLGVFHDDDPNARPGAWVATAAEFGYRADIVPVGCDAGAAPALGITDQVAQYVSVYFSNQPNAVAFVDAISHIDIRTFEVTTYCVAR